MTRREIGGLLWLGALFAVWPVAHTISWREFLLLAGFLIAGAMFRRAPVHAAWWRELRPPFLWIALLTAWMLFVAVFVSGETIWSLDELRGQWSKGVIALFFGVLAAAMLGRDDAAAGRLLLCLGAILLVHVTVIDISFVTAYLRGVSGVRAQGLTGGPDLANYLTNIMLALLLAELLQRQTRGARRLPVPDAVVYAALTLTLFSLVAEGMRNGAAVAAMMLLSWAIIYMVRQRGRPAGLRPFLIAVGVVMLASVLLVLAGSIKPGSSWKDFAGTVSIAWDTAGHKGWLDEKKYGLPSLPDGRPVDASAYLRIAWVKEGLVLMRERPLGVGFGRNAFGHAIHTKYGESGGHSHSSFIDLLAGIGIPGTILWLGFLASLLLVAHRRLQRDPDGGVFALIFVVMDFGARMFVDSNIRDHPLQMFMFLVGVLAVLSVRRGQSATRA